MPRLSKAAISALMAIGFATAASAAVTTFTASLPGGLGPIQPSNGVAAKQSEFRAELADGSVRIEGFESADPGPVGLDSSPSTLSIFQEGEKSALLSGLGDIKNDPYGSPPDEETPGEFFGRFNTTADGTNWWETATPFSITFGSPVSAFGFFVTDLGDFNGTLLLLLYGADGGEPTEVPVAITEQVSGNGSLTFFGFIDIDPEKTFGRIEFFIRQSECKEEQECAEDFLGFDDLIIGALRQTEPPPPPPPPNGAPEPASLSLLGAALLGLVWTARRRRFL